jgi:hypothetical protein
MAPLPKVIAQKALIMTRSYREYYSEAVSSSPDLPPRVFEQLPQGSDTKIIFGALHRIYFVPFVNILIFKRIFLYVHFWERNQIYYDTTEFGI